MYMYAQVQIDLPHRKKQQKHHGFLMHSIASLKEPSEALYAAI